MAERSTERFQAVHPWLERLAWNAAATAVLAVLILLLLASLEWLDQLSARTEPPGRAPSLRAEAAWAAAGARASERAAE